MKKILSIKRQNIDFIYALSLIFIFAITTIKTYGQGKYTAGYIITIQNDTIQGFVKYKDWIQSPMKIAFRKKSIKQNEFYATEIREFGVYSDLTVYQSKKIGLLDITLTREYGSQPSLVAKDSAQLFLKALVLGKHASLYLYLDALERSHYFLESNGMITELINYAYYRKIDLKVHLLQIDKYRNQLKELTETSAFFTDSIPLFQEKHLKRYIINFNDSFNDHQKIYQAKKQKYEFDLDLNVGLESWNEAPVALSNKLTFGIGARLSFPGNHHNRFVKFNIFLTPDILVGYNQLDYRKVTLKTYEIAVGSYIGKGRFRPYIGVHHSGNKYRFDSLALLVGISLDRRLNLELGHLVNFASPVTQTSFLTFPRISLHYIPDLN